MSYLESKSLAYLLHCPGIGHQTARAFKKAVDDSGGDWTIFWDDVVYFIKKKSLPINTIDSIVSSLKEHSIDTYYEMLTKKKIRVITAEDVNYPVLLNELAAPPVVLYILGDEFVLPHTPIAVVGTRHMTAYGAQATEYLVRQLSELGVTIVSGGMYGVDTCAHKTALKHGGSSIAVLGYGFEHWYPQSHQQVLESLMAKGLTCISPFPPNSRPSRGSFSARNAIVAGMSLAVVVTEAGLQSGTHITATCAAELGRSVCAVPGPIMSPYSHGTAWLVNQGATVVTTAQDILNTLPFALQLGTPQAQKEEQEHASAPALYNVLLENGPTTVETLSDMTQQSVVELLCELSQLEISGRVVREGMVWRTR